MFSAHIDVVLYLYLFHRLGICDCVLSSVDMNNNPALQCSLVPLLQPQQSIFILRPKTVLLFFMCCCLCLCFQVCVCVCV